MSAQIDAKIVADRIRAVVRDEPKAFAYDLGLSLSAVYNYMNGRIPTTDVLFRIARYTGQPMEWFLTPEQAAAPPHRSRGLKDAMARAAHAGSPSGANFSSSESRR
jgi:transcriptional regulator with XRE-family HTH domain